MVSNFELRWLYDLLDIYFHLLASQVKKDKVASPDVSLILNSKNEIIADVFYEDASSNDYLPYDSAHP